MSAAIAPITEGPKTSVTDQPNKYDDPEHPSLWVCRFKPNPVYEGPADLYLNKDSQVGLATCVVLKNACMQAFILGKQAQTIRKGYA